MPSAPACGCRPGDARYYDEVENESSYLSQNDVRMHFGLGDAASYDSIEVTWPGGARERFSGGAVNRIVTIRQGTGSRF